MGGKITKTELHEYFNQGMDTKTMAEVYGCTKRNIRHYLKRYGIKMPTGNPHPIRKKRSNVSLWIIGYKEPLPKSYTKIVALSGLPYKDVANFFIRRKNRCLRVIGDIRENVDKLPSFLSIEGRRFRLSQLKDMKYSFDRFTELITIRGEILSHPFVIKRYAGEFIRLLSRIRHKPNTAK